SRRNPYLISLALHLLLLGAGFLALLNNQTSTVPPLVIELTPPEVKKNNQAKNQIVDSKMGTQVQVAPTSGYLGESNRIVEEQTVARPRISVQEPSKSMRRLKRFAAP